MPREKGRKVVASNKKARHDYAILDTYEAGMALTGTEDVHAQKTETTTTLQGSGGTTTASVATPTDTTATFKTTTGTSTAGVKKH